MPREPDGSLYFYLYVKTTTGSSENNFDVRVGPKGINYAAGYDCSSLPYPAHSICLANEQYFQQSSSPNPPPDWDSGGNAPAVVSARRAMVLNLDTGTQLPMLFTQVSKNAAGQTLGVRHFDQDCTGGCGPDSTMEYQMQLCVNVDTIDPCSTGNCEPCPNTLNPACFGNAGTGWVGPNDDWYCPGVFADNCGSFITPEQPEKVNIPVPGSPGYSRFFGPNGECPTSWLRLQSDPSYSQDTTVWEILVLTPTETPTGTPSATPSWTPEPLDTQTASAQQTQTASVRQTQTVSAQQTQTILVSITQTAIAASTSTAHAAATQTALSATETALALTETSTNTPTATQTNTPTHTPSPTSTSTPSTTSTHIPTSTPTPLPQQPTSSPTTPAQTSEPATATHTAIITPSASATTTVGLPSETATAVPTATTCTLAFSDVPPGSTFYSFVQCLACRGIISGYSDGTFHPNNNVTRGQIAKIVSNAAGFNEPPGEQVFHDVLPGSTFYDYTQRLSHRSVMTGYRCGDPGEPCDTAGRPYFRPYNNAVRGQIAKFVANAAGINDPVGAQLFEDVPSTNPFYVYIQDLAQRAIMSGYPCGSPGEPCNQPDNRPYFRTFNNATRGQTSKIVANTFFPDCQPVR